MINPRRRDYLDDEDDIYISRNIVLSADVDNVSVGDIILRILEINRQDDDMEAEIKDFERKPIKLVVNSFGGSVYDGFGLIDCIDQSLTPIHTICYGSAMSMGLLIVVCGHARYCGRYSTLMYHEISTGVDDGTKLTEHKREVKETERLTALYDKILMERSKLTKKQLTTVKDTGKDWYLTPAEALKYQLVDEVLTIKSE